MTEYDIFTECFPQLRLTEKLFKSLTDIESCTLHREPHGFALTRCGSIALICVEPQHQREGIGSRLLRRCEEQLNEYSCITLSGGIFKGAVSDSAGFFRRHGYSMAGEFCEMELPLSNIQPPEHSHENIRFARYDGEHSRLLEAVAAVDEEWVQYFSEEQCVFCGTQNGEIACFCIIEEDSGCLISDDKRKVGSIGCVGTVPKFRKQGAGLTMVYLAARELSCNGCDSVFIHYTHLDKWYGKLGAHTVLRFMPAEKRLNNTV